MNHYLEHKSQYTGGFIKTNGRTNNSSKYNHDYYIHNIHKWKKSKRYKNNENDKNDDWQQVFEEAEREARKRNPGYQPPEDVDDFEVMLLEMGYDTTKHSQDELNKMYLMSKKNNRRIKHMNIYSSELYHHGIKGQKWGQRHYQYDDGTYTPEGKRRYGFGLGNKNRGAAYTNMKNKKAQYKAAKKNSWKAYSKAYNKSIAAYSPFKKHREASRKRWEETFDKFEAESKAKNEYKKAKKDYKQSKKDARKAKIEARRNAVAKYKSDYNKASSMLDRNDKMWKDVKQQYKSLGKNRWQRVKAVYQATKGKGTKEAQKYLKDWNKASTQGDKASEKWYDVQQQYEQLGKTRLGRIYANIDYELSKKKKKK